MQTLWAIFQVHLNKNKSTAQILHYVIYRKCSNLYLYNNNKECWTNIYTEEVNWQTVEEGKEHMHL